MLISNVLFECHGVSAFKIPPGPISLTNWDSKTVVWKGSVRLLEEEQTAVPAESASHMGLRLKLELYNKKTSSGVSDHFRGPENMLSWAEVWYNPFSETELDFKVANDGSDTVVMTEESSKYYRIISQLPDTGYSPLRSSEKGFLRQVALGLHFEDSFSASSFSESLAIYKRHFKNFQEKFRHDANAPSLESSFQTSLALPKTDSETLANEIDDDDEFGNFVSSSYD